MTDAFEAIRDLQEALTEYGSDITLKKVIQGTYNPQTGNTTQTVTDYNMRAIIKRYASESLSRSISENTIVSSYELSLLVYHTEEIKKDWKVIFKGQTYQILYVSPTTLQNENISYELLIKK